MTTTLPRGLRVNNPGNIVQSGHVWQGKVTPSADSRFEQFDTPENGLLALCQQLLFNRDLHACLTITDQVSRWAPPTENNTAAYIAAVVKFMGVTAKAELQLQNPSTLALMAMAITVQEQGVQPFSVQQLRDAANTALQLPADTPVAVPAPKPSTNTGALPTPTPTVPPVKVIKRPDQEVTDVPDADVDDMEKQFKLEGYTVIRIKQGNGKWTVKGTKP